MLGVGFVWVVSAALGTLAGVWLDGRWGTAPVFTLVGVVVGTVAGFAYMYHHAVVAPRERSRRERDRE
jgi:F0F1-type ATP synthase assembly protein I